MDLVASFKKRFTELLGVNTSRTSELALPVTRDLAALSAAADAEPAVMFLLHASPFKAGCGGTEVHTLDCVRHLKLARAIIVYPSGPKIITVAEVRNGDVDAPVYYALRLQRALTWYSLKNSEAEHLLVMIARKFDVGAAVIEHLHMWPLALAAEFSLANLPYIYVVHDFFSVCPSLNLVNANILRPCTVHYGGANDSARCLQSTFAAQQTTPPSDVQDLLKQHQANFADIFSQAQAVVFPSESARKRILANVKLEPKKTHVIPHGYPQFSPPSFKGGPGGVTVTGKPPPNPPLLRGGNELLRVSLAGMLAAPIKGSDLIIELLSAMKAQPIEWHIFGIVDANNFRQRLESTGARLMIHGPYERETLIPKLRAAGVDVALFMSIAEETFSYTLSEAWCAGIPALVPRWGALGERVEQTGFGWAIEPHSAAAAAAKLTELASSREQIAAIQEKLKSFRHVSLEENAAAYRALLEPLLKKTRKPAAPPSPPHNDELVDTEKWRAAFAASEKSVFQLDVSRADSLQVLNHATLSTAPDGIRVESSGNDPALTMPEFNFARAFHILRLEISSPAEDVLQLFYATANAPGFAESRSLKSLIYKGRNEVFLMLNVPGLAGVLRLDPGTHAGAFTIHALELRAI
jgi:glycosyltransferase involved in cell wall biosynthesis